MAREANYQTLTGVLNELERRGCTEHLLVVSNRLRVAETETTFRPDSVMIRKYRRCEDVSDPDDIAIVFAIETKDGIGGALADGYGVNSDAAVSAFSAFLKSLPIVEEAR